MDVINALENATDREILDNWREIQKILDGVQHRKEIRDTKSILRKQYKNNNLIDSITDINDTICDSLSNRTGEGEFKVMCKRVVTLRDTKPQLWFECWGNSSGGWNDPQINIYGHNIDIDIPESIDQDSAIEILEQIFDSVHKDVAEYYYSKVDYLTNSYSE